ncbi:MAG: NPXTG-anchored protein [Ruminococcus sp.]|nr:NPXTG-anchored protein [Ruminococcus sp.]
MSLYTPQQDGEQTPTFGIKLGCSNITEVDDAGAISGNITNFHIEASTNVDLDDTTISGDLLGKQESWGLSGNSQQVDFSDQIKDKLGADDAAYMEWLESVSEVSYTLELTQCEAKGVVMKAADAGESSVAESSAAESSAASSTATSSTATSSKSSTTSSKSSTTSSKSSTTTSSKAASSTAASDNTANTATGATAGIALAGLALAGAVAVVSKKK